MYSIADAAGHRIADLQQPEPEQANLNCSNISFSTLLLPQRRRETKWPLATVSNPNMA
jgi:hypothetical protein